VNFLDVILMAMVAIVTVIALQSVGLVLAVAMLIIPAASARYWTTKITTMLFVSALIGCLSGWLGSVTSALIPRMPTGPIIVLICGLWFILSFIVGPKGGIFVRQVARIRLNRRIAMQHILRGMWEVCEDAQNTEFSIEEIVYVRSWSKQTVVALLKRCEKMNFATRVSTNKWRLTQKGLAEASRIVRNHRLWEVYLITYADIAPTHVDRDADMIEHVLGKDLVAKLEDLLDSSAVPKSPHPIGESV
jgi:manganese/zinc/iron transport system permease protein